MFIKILKKKHFRMRIQLKIRNNKLANFENKIKCFDSIKMRKKGKLNRSFVHILSKFKD